jgi:hypothetical protein
MSRWVGSMSLTVDQSSVDKKSVDELSVDGLSPHRWFTQPTKKSKLSVIVKTVCTWRCSPSKQCVMNQGHENSRFSWTGVNQFLYCVATLNEMLQVWTCLEFAALKEAENCRCRLFGAVINHRPTFHRPRHFTDCTMNRHFTDWHFTEMERYWHPILT